MRTIYGMLVFSLIGFPAFAQAPPVDPLIADLQGAWSAKTYGDAQSVKALDAIIKAWQADKAALAEARKELESLKSKPEPPK